MDEEIICFERKVLSEYLDRSHITPILPFDEALWNRILDNLQSFPRPHLENDYRFKQLVVYVVIKSKDSYLTYKRTTKGLEKRLSEKYSIGIGGHVNVADKKQLTLIKDKKDLVRLAVLREVNEEINIKSRILKEPKLICFINDDSDDVGRIHFGVVWLLEISEPDVSRRGRVVGDLKFYGLRHLKDTKYRFEKWSQLLIDYFNIK